jgi:hypothetical protein
MHAWLEGKALDDSSIYVRQSHSWMLGENVTSAGFTPLAITLRGLVIRANVVRTPSDLHGLGFPKSEGIDGTCRPVPTRVAMAISHADRLATYSKLNRSTKAASRVSLLVAHDGLLCIQPGNRAGLFFLVD